MPSLNSLPQLYATHKFIAAFTVVGFVSLAGATNGHGVGNGVEDDGESEEEEEEEEAEELNFKLVLAEPLEGAEDSHVQKFLDAHGGPGLQVKH